MTIASTVAATKENNVGAVVGVTVGVGTIFVIVIIIATFLVCYFCRLNKKTAESAVALDTIALDDENMSYKKAETLNKEIVKIESSS